MTIKLTPKDFYRGLARRDGEMSIEQSQKYWEMLNEYILGEILRCGSIFLPNMGELCIVEKGGKNAHVPDNENIGKTKIIYIEPYYMICFKPSEVFKQNVNNGRLPRAALKRERERYRHEKETEIKAEDRKNLVYKQKEAMEKAKIQRENRIRKSKERYRMSKKKQGEMDALENYNPYDYGEVEE